MKKNNLKKIFLPLAACSGLALASSAHAATLVFDDFDGDIGTNLVGTTADVGGTWEGASNADMKADGSLIAGGERSAYQAVTIAGLYDMVRGFDDIKLANVEQYRTQLADALAGY